jgi:hypothetical protein
VNPGDIVELTENYTTYPPRGQRVTLRAGAQFTVRKLLVGLDFVGVTDDTGAVWQLPIRSVEVVKRAPVKA